MRISERIEKSLVVVGQSWQTFEHTVAALAQLLVEAGRLRAELLQETVVRICRREQEASMTMADVGLSIPHVRVEGIEGIAWSLAIAVPAVFSVGVGLPIPIVALVLSAPSATGEHLEFLSSLSLLLQSGNCRRRLLGARSSQEVLEILRAFEQRGPRWFADRRPC